MKQVLLYARMSVCHVLMLFDRYINVGQRVRCVFCGNIGFLTMIKLDEMACACGKWDTREATDQEESTSTIACTICTNSDGEVLLANHPSFHSLVNRVEDSIILFRVSFAPFNLHVIIALDCCTEGKRNGGGIRILSRFSIDCGTFRSDQVMLVLIARKQLMLQ